jgi:hypothetical protein
LKTWLFKPFDRIPGNLALGLGLGVLAVTALLAWRAGLHTDGVIDLHFGPSVAFWAVMIQGLINWLSLSILLLLAGRWLGRARFSALDLSGCQALARWPMLIGVIWLSIPPIGGAIERRTASMTAAMPDQPGQVIAPIEHMLDAMWLLVLSLPVLAAIAWMVWLMYHAYTRITGLRGARAVLSFAAALVVAEMLSKISIHFLLGMAA